MNPCAVCNGRVHDRRLQARSVIRHRENSPFFLRVSPYLTAAARRPGTAESEDGYHGRDLTRVHHRVLFNDASWSIRTFPDAFPVGPGRDSTASRVRRRRPQVRRLQG